MVEATDTLSQEVAQSLERTDYYWLRAYPHPDSSSQNASDFSGLYLRLHGSGTNSVMLVPSSPIYLRCHFEPVSSLAKGAESVSAPEVPKDASLGRQIFTSHAQRHVGRSWGLALTVDPRDSKALAGWERVEIVDGSTEVGWTFETVEIEASQADPSDTTGSTSHRKVVEQLVWKGGPVRFANANDSGDQPEEDGYEWRGWMACVSSYGHPQLFWITDKLKDSGLPPHCERMMVVREWLESKTP